MTACKDSLNGKKAVSATLAGVLAVGMVPAAAFAAEAPADEAQNDGIELLDTTSAVTLFNAGTIALDSTFSPVSGKTNQFTANATTDGSALDPRYRYRYPEGPVCGSRRGRRFQGDHHQGRHRGEGNQGSRHLHRVR